VFERSVLCLAFVVGVSACSAGKSVPRSTGSVSEGLSSAGKRAGSSVEARPRSTSGARWVPPQAGAEAVLIGDAHRFQYLVGSLRAIEDATGQVTTAEQLLPTAKWILPVELPARLGGGFLFFATAQGTTMLRSQTWTGALSALARFEGKVEAVEVGFSSVLVKAESWFALDPEQGSLGPPAGLPPAPAYEQIAIMDAWFGAVKVPFQGVLVTYDAGQSWLPLGIAGSLRLRKERSLLWVDAEKVSYALDAKGRLTEQPASGPTDFEDEEGVAGMTEASRASTQPGVAVDDSAGDSPQRSAVASGFLESTDVAVLARNSELLRVKLSTGHVMKVGRHALDGDTCSPLRLGASDGFVCHNGANETLIYRYLRNFSLVKIGSFKGPRRVSASSSGALTISGSCASALGTSKDAHCVLFPGGEAREVRVNHALGGEKVLGMLDGTVLILTPPARGHMGSVRIWGAKKQKNSAPIKWPALDADSLRLLRYGVWLDGFRLEGAEIRGWVMDNATLVGVKLRVDGKLTPGDPIPIGAHPLLSGPYALVPAGDGTARESTDGGMSWNEVPLPMDERTILTSREQRAGCSAVGCVLGDWLRIGWQGTASLRKIRAPANPLVRSLPSPGGNRWLFSCRGPSSVGPRAVVRSEPLREGHAPRARVLRGAQTPEKTAPWEAFWHLPPPRRPSYGRGLEFGTESEDMQVHGYLWTDNTFPTNAWWQLYFADRFRVDGGIQRTLPSDVGWKDEAQATQAFGGTSSRSGSNWTAELEPASESGALLIRSAGKAELFAFEANHPLLALGTAGVDLQRLAGIVKLGERLFVASVSTRELLVFEVNGGVLQERLRVPLDRAQPRLFPRLVRNLAGDLLGVWARAENGAWFVYPIDLEAGKLLEPTWRSARELATTPRSCKYDEDGWLLQGHPELLPHFEFLGGASELRVSLPETRLVLREDGICLQALAARADNSVTLRAEPIRDNLGVPLVVTDRRQGLRWGFSCEPAGTAVP